MHQSIYLFFLYISLCAKVDSMMAVKWYGSQDNNTSNTSATPATDDDMLLTKKYLDHLNERVTQAKVAQELAARRHR